MEVAQHNSSGQFIATMRIVVENTTEELLKLDVKMVGSVNGKASPNGIINYEAIMYAKAENYLSYDSISDVSIEINEKGFIGPISGELEYEIKYTAHKEQAVPRVSGKMINYRMAEIPPGKPGDHLQMNTIIAYSREKES